MYQLGSSGLLCCCCIALVLLVLRGHVELRHRCSIFVCSCVACVAAIFSAPDLTAQLGCMPSTTLAAVAAAAWLLWHLACCLGGLLRVACWQHVRLSIGRVVDQSEQLHLHAGSRLCDFGACCRCCCWRGGVCDCIGRGGQHILQS